MEMLIKETELFGGKALDDSLAIVNSEKVTPK
jgi:hypothetical protein